MFIANMHEPRRGYVRIYPTTPPPPPPPQERKTGEKVCRKKAFGPTHKKTLKGCM